MGRGKFVRILSPLPTTALEIPPTRLLEEAKGMYMHFTQLPLICYKITYDYSLCIITFVLPVKHNS